LYHAQKDQEANTRATLPSQDVVLYSLKKSDALLSTRELHFFDAAKWRKALARVDCFSLYLDDCHGSNSRQTHHMSTKEKF